jgi:Predicted membrane protein (DUF2207)
MKRALILALVGLAAAGCTSGTSNQIDAPSTTTTTTATTVDAPVTNPTSTGASTTADTTAGDERITSLWVSATVDDAGQGSIVELIEWDFGSAGDRHGIYREIPGLSVDAPVSAEIDGAHTDVLIEPASVNGEPGTSIRVGDPTITVSGRHRYELRYPLSGLTTDDGRLAWDAVGLGWDVPSGPVEVHLVAPFELSDVACHRGPAGSTNLCDDVRQPVPGHLTAAVQGLAAGEGITLVAHTGANLPSAPAAPTPPA